MNYTIEGAPLPVVICNLEGGETMLTEKGAMCLSRINCRRGNVCFFPKTHCRRSLRRRRIYHAASVRKRHRLSRI